ncbi:MAG: hypothetical protein A2X81_16885 [Desulfobacterales bacterium GWB2_56_26]|nr:MAG: hypothetical protein A2X81_16885 [Desulfobacterales bacterium GWB2_56_26]
MIAQIEMAPIMSHVLGSLIRGAWSGIFCFPIRLHIHSMTRNRRIRLENCRSWCNLSEENFNGIIKGITADQNREIANAEGVILYFMLAIGSDFLVLISVFGISIITEDTLRALRYMVFTTLNFMRRK